MWIPTRLRSTRTRRLPPNRTGPQKETDPSHWAPKEYTRTATNQQFSFPTGQWPLTAQKTTPTTHPQGSPTDPDVPPEAPGASPDDSGTSPQAPGTSTGATGTPTNDAWNSPQEPRASPNDRGMSTAGAGISPKMAGNPTEYPWCCTSEALGGKKVSRIPRSRAARRALAGSGSTSGGLTDGADHRSRPADLELHDTFNGFLFQQGSACLNHFTYILLVKQLPLVDLQ